MTPSPRRRPAVRAFAGLLLAAAPLASSASAQPTTAPAATQPSEPRTRFVNGVSWPDTNGKHINAHGGGVIHHEGTYYWFGENRGRRTPEVRYPPSPGVSVYTSTDLYNWTDAGIALATVDDEQSPITRGCNIERPKVVYNARTGKFVMWFHLELKGRGYGAALAGLAVADKPTGPFTFIKALRPNANVWPIEFTTEQRVEAKPDAPRLEGRAWREALVEGMYARRDFKGGQMSRDMTLYVDPDDGKGYLLSSSEENYTLALHELTDDYLDFTGKWTRLMPGGHNEAPAVIKHEGKYHLLASGCTGWDPNAARSYVADSMWGPWTSTGNPTHGINPANKLGPEKTWGGQSTWMLPVPNKPGAFVAMFDVWRPRNLQDSGYIWLPVEFRDGKLSITWRDEWDMSVFDR